MIKQRKSENILLVNSDADGSVVALEEGLSFWGGVDPNSGLIIDPHHPNYGEDLSNQIVMMPSSIGSCSGSGVLLELARKGIAPAALVFKEPEDILTLGALVATRMYNCSVAILRLTSKNYKLLSQAKFAVILNSKLSFSGSSILLKTPNSDSLVLTELDLCVLNGDAGPAKRLALEMICALANAQEAKELINVSRAHIDGCILAHDANLDFAIKMKDMGAKVSIPTTINAISVDKENWLAQGVDRQFGQKASQLADTYVQMGCNPTFTCAPYLLEEIPGQGECIAWSESNAVIFANSVLGARSHKNPDFLDLFMAIVGRAPKTGVYLSENRVALCKILVSLPKHYDDSIWPMLGWLIGKKSPNEIPLIMGLEKVSLKTDDLKAICAAFGTTSAAAMIHIKGHTPEANLPFKSFGDQLVIKKGDLRKVWQQFNFAGDTVDLIAIGSPHASLSECQKFAHFLNEKGRVVVIRTIITVGRHTYKCLQIEGVLQKLQRFNVEVMKDVCWCSINKPIIPDSAKVLMTNSGKYTSYGKALTGRDIRFGSLRDCADTASTGVVENDVPTWLMDD